MRLVAALIAVPLLLSGCFEPCEPETASPTSPPPVDPLAYVANLDAGGTRPWDEQRPVHWDSTPELVTYHGFRNHGATQTLAAYPADPEMPRPASCVAYQTGRVAPGDNCTVRGPEMLGDAEYGPWTIHAFWDGTENILQIEERDPGRRTVVTFHASGIEQAHVPKAVPTMIE